MPTRPPVWIAAAAAAAAAATAHADIVDMKFVGTGLGHNVRVTAGDKSFNTYAGQLTHRILGGDDVPEALRGDQILYCADLLEYTTGSFKPYVVSRLTDVPDSNPMHQRQADALRDIYAFAEGQQLSASGSNDFAAAFQLAVWEIVSDYDWDQGRSSLDLETGFFQATKRNGKALSSGIMNNINGLFDAVGSDSEFRGLVALRSETNQDQLAVIPAPASVSMFTAGLCLIATRRRR